MEISMCSAPWENPFAERINRTIKEEYLNGWKIGDFAALSRCLRKAVNHYNRKRSHDSLNKLSPIEFEKQLSNKNLKELVKVNMVKH